MKIGCYHTPTDPILRTGVTVDNVDIFDLTSVGIHSPADALEQGDIVDRILHLTKRSSMRIPVANVLMGPPVNDQEIWAAGVTYLRSKTARMEESDFSASAYDRVYDAERPEIFFKALGWKTSGPGRPVGIRHDARWSVPEPELVLVYNRRGDHVGYTIGNDMSSRDIEGENLLYLPQAKTYSASCAIGPWIRVGVEEAEARSWGIRMEILRDGRQVFAGGTQVSQIKRSFSELSRWLHCCQKFPTGSMLLTGTGIVPPNEFTLQAGDRVVIEIDGIGRLENPVAVV